MRRPPESLMPRQLTNDPETSEYGGTVTIVLSKFWTLMTVSEMSVTGAVDAVLGHLDPVADAQHVVLGDHHARDQPQDRVLEYQHQDGREGAQPRNQVDRRLVDQDRDDDDDHDAGEDHLKDLDESLDRTVFQLSVVFQRVAHGVQDRVDGDHQHDEEVDPRDPFAYGEPCGVGGEGEGQQRGDDQGRNERRRFAEDAVPEQRIEEIEVFAFEDLPGRADEQEVDDGRHDERDRDDAHEKQDLVQFVEQVARNAYP